MLYRVFIHTNDKQLIGALVSRYSLYKNTRNKNRFTVDIINLKDFPALFNRQGTSYLREGRTAVWQNDDLQSFTPLRFLPPQLMGYEGRALVIDPDVFALSDVWQLLERPMHGHAVLARRVQAAGGRPAYWASSVMLLDCDRLRHWRWETQLDEMFSLRRDYRKWVSLELEPNGSVGGLEEHWNHFDRLDETTKLLHNTGRITQPWKTGLPIDFAAKHAPRSGVIRNLRTAISALLGNKRPTRGHYQKHPDPRQESLFFRMLRECVEAGEVSEAFIKEEIGKRHIRPDALRLLASAR